MKSLGDHTKMEVKFGTADISALFLITGSETLDQVVLGATKKRPITGSCMLLLPLNVNHVIIGYYLDDQVVSLSVIKNIT